MSTTVTQTDVERRAGGDGNEYTFDEFLNYHNGDRKAAQADWNNSAAGLTEAQRLAQRQALRQQMFG